MVMVDCMNVGISTISKAAMNRGSSNFVFVVYTNAFFPHFIFTRNKRPPLTFSLLWRFFLVGLTGMEKLNLRSTSSQAKSVGTAVSVAGALIVTLYKGPSLMGSSPTNSPSQLPLSQQSKWILGGFLILITNLMSAIWNIVQAAIIKVYPEEMTLVFFYIFFVTIQSLVFSLILERDPVAWKPNSAIEIMAIVFTAVVGSVIRVSVHTWCLHKKGPVYIAMFRPLEIVFAAIMSIIFLAETIHLGSVIGSVIIVFGFYTLIWGKIKEKSMDVDNEVRNLESSSHKTPLLQSSCNEYSPRNS